MRICTEEPFGVRVLHRLRGERKFSGIEDSRSKSPWIASAPSDTSAQNLSAEV
jgi:hypothetical protein